MIKPGYPLTTAFLLSLLIAAIAAPFVFRLLVKLNSRQTVSEHVQEHAHKQGTPTMGGWIILIAWWATVWILKGSEARDVLLIVTLFATIGFVDDYVVPRMLQGKRGLGWKQKLALQVAGTMAILMAGGTGVHLAAIATFVILFMSNAYNFADGMDALAASIGIFVALGIAFLGYFAGLQHIALYMAALMGAFLPFLFLNAPPAKVFMGDVGALPIGALFGHQLVEVAVRSQTMNWLLYLAPMTVLTLILIIELVPVPIQIASVKLRGKRVFPRTPIHHAFQHVGWPETRVVWMFIIAQGLCTMATIAWVQWMEGKLL